MRIVHCSLNSSPCANSPRTSPQFPSSRFSSSRSYTAHDESPSGVATSASSTVTPDPASTRPATPTGVPRASSAETTASVSSGSTATSSVPEVVVRPGVPEACEALGMDPWRATTSGTLLVAVNPDDTDAVVGALEARGTPVGVAGRVEAGSSVTVDDADVEDPDGDSSWAVYERLLAASGSESES